MKLCKIAVCAALALAVFALGACGGKGAQTKEVKLNRDSLSLEIGERKVLELLQDGEPISEGVTWFSSKSEVASVERTTGLVTAVGSGPCVITAAYQEKSYPCNVQVAEEPAYTMSAAALELPEGETATLSLLEDGEPVAERVTWVSSNPAVASVKDGTVTAKKEGETVIGASYQGHEASCAVTVVPPEYVKIVNEAEEITYDGPDTEKKEVRRTLFKKENETFALQCETKNDISLVYSSSDDAVAEIDGAGNVTAKSAGAAVLTAKSAEAGPDGRVYGDEIVLVVSGAVAAAGFVRGRNVFLLPHRRRHAGGRFRLCGRLRRNGKRRGTVLSRERRHETHNARVFVGRAGVLGYSCRRRKDFGGVRPVYGGGRVLLQNRRRSHGSDV